MTRYPSLTRALHQLDRHGSGTPGDVPPEPTTPTGIFLAGFAAATRAAFTGPFWPLGQFPDTQRSKKETT